ncbi:uncharacterized protein LOC135468134 isoform X2 [Liolophura sinensis]|uniref:uncharacterized protein LOC135468134 isoform X2 n=1 Tax=Liolophura sinensis TaxID=3198878 RepID=UPI0031591DE3
MSYEEMLKLLSQKLRSQSLDGVQPTQSEAEEERDSGTESDDENAELEQLELQRMAEVNQQDTSSYGSLSPTLISGETDSCSNSPQFMSELTTLTLGLYDQISELEQGSWGFDDHSSEEELSSIHSSRELQAEKRKWSQMTSGRRQSHGDSTPSSDEEVRDLMLQPQPVLFHATPPRDAHRVSRHSPARLYLANLTPVTCSVSPRKRHRKTAMSGWTEYDRNGNTQRPCLDFEKMQKTLVKKHNSHHSLGRAKVVKIRTRSALTSTLTFGREMVWFVSSSVDSHTTRNT